MAYETNAIGLDLSHYDHTVDAAQLKGNVDFLIVKAGGSEDAGGVYQDTRFAERVQLAYDIGVPCGAYWFVGPRYWLEKQHSIEGIEKMTDEQHPLLQFIMATLKHKLIHWLAFDVEDASLRSSAGEVTDVWIKFYISDLIERIQRQQANGKMRQFKLGVYSRRSFMDTSGQEPPKPQTSLSIYLGSQPNLFIWTANWAGKDTFTLPMNEIYKKRPVDNHIPYSFGWCKDRPQTWQFWQWSGDSGRVFKCTGIKNDQGQYRPVDIDMFNGTAEQLRAWAGVTPPVDDGDEGGGDTGSVDLSGVNAKLDAIQAELAAAKARWEQHFK